MKETGIAKITKKKWSRNPAMETKAIASNKPLASRSFLQVEEDVHFVLDDNELGFRVTTPNSKAVELSRRTYSKRNPIIYRPVISQESTETLEVDISVNGSTTSSSSSSVSKSSTLSSKGKTLLRKRKIQLESVDSKLVGPKKTLKRSASVKPKGASQSCAAKVPQQPTNRSLNSTPIRYDCSSDSDIEVLSVKLCKPPSALEAKPSNGSMKRLSHSFNNFNSRKSNQCFESEANKELQVNEADIAPFMPTNPNVFPDARSRANSMRWLSANGSIAVPGYSQGFSQNSDVQIENNNVVPLPEMKSLPEKVPNGREKVTRELKGLYENLNEISWAHDTSFKNLLRSPDYIRHSERSTGRIAGTGKNLRKVKPLQKAQAKRMKQTTAANLLARKKSKIARLNHTQKSKQAMRSKLIPNLLNGNESEKPNAKKKNTSVKSKSPPVTKDSTDEDEVRYKLSDTLLSKMKLVEGTKAKVVVPKTKTANGPKLKPDPPKIKSETHKLKPNFLKLKPDGPKTKTSVKLKPSVPHIKSDYSPPSTSGLQNGACSSKSTFNSKPGMKNLLKKVSNFGLKQELKVFPDMLGSDEELFSAVKKGSKLRVRLQPLEHTNLWNSDFFEEFKKHVFDQAVKKAIEIRDNESVQGMFDSILDAHPNVNGGNNRVPKKKKPEEEALRSSVRQSEGAFRYKEIVVRRHSNYMQVVLVPNEAKQNTLTMEAMKELKDAFLLARRDPNCRAVLLNSSGPYFCTGVDLSPLIGSNKKQAAEDLANTISDLVMTLSLFPKPVVAAVNGAALGFGVSLLTYCDVVLASDKATFCLPAAKIGYIPEGGITLTLPQVVGSSVASEMFLQGRRLTAEQAFRHGLVSEVLWPTRLMNEVVPRLKNIISHPSFAMEATKAMVRCNLWDKLKLQLEREKFLLTDHWLKPHCQANIKSLLQTGWLAD